MMTENFDNIYDAVQFYEGYDTFHLIMMSNDVGNLDNVYETILFGGIGGNMKESYQPNIVSKLKPLENVWFYF